VLRTLLDINEHSVAAVFCKLPTLWFGVFVASNNSWCILSSKTRFLHPDEQWRYVAVTTHVLCYTTTIMWVGDEAFVIICNCWGGWQAKKMLCELKRLGNQPCQLIWHMTKFFFGLQTSNKSCKNTWWEQSIVISMCVCLFVHELQSPASHVHASPNFLCLLAIIVARIIPFLSCCTVMLLTHTNASCVDL